MTGAVREVRVGADPAIARAVKLLRSQGWQCWAPPKTPRPQTMPDQCEYPDWDGWPGDTCRCDARRRRTTKHGWLWLCDEHFHAPLPRLFETRPMPALAR